MNIQTLTAFFKWTTTINIALFAFSALAMFVTRDLIYSTHGQIYQMPREALEMILYSFLGLYKLFILVFNLVPFIALLIVAKKEQQIEPGK